MRGVNHYNTHPTPYVGVWRTFYRDQRVECRAQSCEGGAYIYIYIYIYIYAWGKQL